MNDLTQQQISEALTWWRIVEDVVNNNPVLLGPRKGSRTDSPGSGAYITRSEPDFLTPPAPASGDVFDRATTARRARA